MGLNVMIDVAGAEDIVGVSADRTNLSPFTKDFRALALVTRLLHI